MDGALDGTGYPETLAWAQVYRRALVVAEELRRYGSTGDRAAIVAPQGLGYIVAFLGAIQAGFIAVPLSAPQYGVHDERVSSVLRDCAHAVAAIITTSAAVDAAAPDVRGEGRNPAPALIDVDSLDFGFAAACRFRPRPRRPALRIFSTHRDQPVLPAGVVISAHKNVVVNVEQALERLLRRRSAPQEAVFVSWLPFYHDMGLIKGVCTPLVCGPPRSADESAGLPAATGPLWIQQLAKNPGCFSAAPNFAFELGSAEEHLTTTWQDSTSATCTLSAAAPNGFTPPRLKRFTDRFAAFQLKESPRSAVVRSRRSDRLRGDFEPRSSPAVVRFDYEKLSSGHAKPCADARSGSTELIGHGSTRATAMRIVDPETGAENPAGQVGEIWVHGDNVAKGYWKKPKKTQRVFGGRIVNPSNGTPESPWLRTGDLGVIPDGELFIIGRIKDLLIVDGSNHYPDDIEATIQEISKGRVRPYRSRPRRRAACRRSSNSRSVATPTMRQIQRLRR